MKAVIENGPVFTTLTINLANGESVKAEPGAMISMSSNIKLESKTSGKGIFGAIKAAVGGESLFTSIYTAEGSDGEVIFAPGVPGDVIEFEMTGQTLYAQSGAYMAGSPDLELSTKGSLRAMMSGEGLFLQKITGSGKVFLNSYGAVYMKDLKAGEHYIVDTGHMVAFEESASYTVKKAAKGLFSTLASGEGLVADFVGPGKVWIQTRNLSSFASALQPFFSK